MSRLKAAVLGGGSFGTAIANVIADNGYHTCLWMRDASRAQHIQQSRVNARYLPDLMLSPQLTITADRDAALLQADVVFVAIPSASFREVLLAIKSTLPKQTLLVSTTKGIDKDGFMLMSQIIADILPNNPVGVLSGPTFAKEMVGRQLTGSVIASRDEKLVTAVQLLLSSESFRIYSSDDCYGVELAGALKNIYAIIAGMAKARAYGHNTMALLMTRALAEMGRFAHKLGADPMTFLGLAGVGDLILTCGSDLSRNYRVGYALGSGQTLTAAMKSLGQVVEGVNTLRLVKSKAEELGVAMPLVEALYALLFEDASPDSIIKQLMLSGQNSDVDFTGAMR